MKSVIQVSAHYVFKPAVRAVMKHLPKVGEVKHVWISIREARGIEPGREWLLRKGLFLDILIHAWEILIELFKLSSPDEVRITQVRAARYEGAPIKAETSGRVKALLPGGVEVDILIGKGILDDKFMEIHGTEGILKANISSGEVRFVDRKGEERILQGKTPDDSYDRLLKEAFLGRPPTFTFEKGLLALRLVEKAREGIENLITHPLGTPPPFMADRVKVKGCRVEVYRTTEEANRAVIREIILAARESIKRSGDFCMAIPGGTSFPPIISLAKDEALGEALDLARIHWFQGDEHCVPLQDGENNNHLALEAGLARLIEKGLHAHRIPTQGEDGKPLDLEALREGTAKYEAKFKALRPDGQFDLVILGLGARDCHVASILPSKEGWINPLLNSDKIFDVVEYPESYGLRAPLRVSLTPKGIRAAGKVLLIAFGPRKRAALNRILHAPVDVRETPGTLIRSLGKVITDRDAAAGILQP